MNRETVTKREWN